MPEITNDELARRLSDIRNEVRDDLAEIRRAQERYVLREVHDAKMSGVNDRITRIEVTSAQHEEQRRGDRRWFIAAIVMPAVAVLVTLFLALRGP